MLIWKRPQDYLDNKTLQCAALVIEYNSNNTYKIIKNRFTGDMGACITRYNT